MVELMGAFLTPAEVGRVARSCRFFRQVCVTNSASSEKLWKAVCFRLWPLRSSLNGSEARDWRTFSLERQTCDRRWEKGLRGSPAVSTMIKSDESPVFNVHKRGDMVASAEDCCVRIWDLARKTCQKTFACNSSGNRMVLGVFLTEDQSTVLSGGADGDIKVWDVKRGTCGRVLTGHSGAVVTLKADANKIVSTSFDGTCKVWSWRGRCEQTLIGHRGHVCGLSFQESEPRNVWTGADDGLVK
ncbi:WD40-repeat-containing domain protein [Baffinella frigidus]|nr:WD40-repeat-containing domain protein [Cryptophyta sp. CCMP2293]